MCHLSWNVPRSVWGPTEGPTEGHKGWFKVLGSDLFFFFFAGDAHFDGTAAVAWAGG